MKANHRDLSQFTEAVKNRLSFRLAGVNLDLIDAGLQRADTGVVTPGVDVFALVGWVRRPATGEMKDFAIRIGGNIRKETDIEAIDPLCTKIVESLVEAFYAKVASA